MDQVARIARVIKDYDTQGIHRTATSVDEASAHWLADEVRSIGLEPSLQGYEIHRLDPGECYLEVGGRQIPGVPLYDCNYTDANGVTGRLTAEDGSGDIRLVNVEQRASELAATRRGTRAKALVIVTAGHDGGVFTHGDTPGLALQNAYDFDAPFGPPALQLSNAQADWIRQQTENHAEARLVATADRTWAHAYNVTAELPGNDGTLAPLVINTPRSGWWEIAAERGSGIACWLEVMRGLARQRTSRRVFFSANSGHELGFSGIEKVLDTYADLATDATWLHFGANIGATSGTMANVAASTAELQQLAEPALARVHRPTQYTVGKSDGGEMASVHRRGGRRYLALTNDNAYFHMREDRFANNVDVSLVAQYAEAFSGIARVLAGH